MGIGVHLIDLFLVVLLKQKLKLEFLATISSFDFIDFFFVSSCCRDNSQVLATI
jgi:hypothetical protein